jgi:hypothetical protein
MRPITRALFTLCSAASLLVCAALILAWLTRNVGDAVRVRVVGNAILLFGADGGAVQLADAFYFNPDHPLNRGNYAGPTGLVWQLRAGGLAGTQATKHTIAGIVLRRVLQPSFSVPRRSRADGVPRYGRRRAAVLLDARAHHAQAASAWRVLRELRIQPQRHARSLSRVRHRPG